MNYLSLIEYFFFRFKLSVRQEIADVLKEYVKQGGCIVADARTATVNELDFAYKISPGAGLDALFGTVRTDWIGQKNAWSVKINKQGINPSGTIEGKYFRDHLRITDKTDVIGTFADDGSPAVIKHQFGKGTAILSAVPLGGSYYGKPENPVNKLLWSFMKNAGVRIEAHFTSKDKSVLDLKIHDGDKNKIVYAINTEDHSKSGIIEIYLGSYIIKSVKSILTEKSMPFKQKGVILSIPVSIEKQSAQVFLIE